MPVGAPRTREIAAAIFVPNISVAKLRGFRCAGAGGQVQTVPLRQAMSALRAHAIRRGPIAGRGRPGRARLPRAVPAAEAAGDGRRARCCWSTCPRPCRWRTATRFCWRTARWWRSRRRRSRWPRSRPPAAVLARLAWHVGNRHTPAEIGDGRILVQRDHVIEEMLARLGAAVRHVTAPFRPEGGAYGHGRTHGHHHGGAEDDPHAPRASERGGSAADCGRGRSSRPGSRPAIRSAPTATATGSSGRSRPGTVRDGAASRPGSRTWSSTAPAVPTPCCSPPPGGPRIPVPVAELAEALAPSAERHLETMAQGAAFARITAAAWGIEVPDAAYPVAVGVAARRIGLPLAPTATLYLQGFAANLVSAGVRLVPLGQTEGQRIVAAADAARGARSPRRRWRRRARRSGGSRSRPISRRCGTRRSTRGSIVPSAQVIRRCAA